MSTDTLSPDRFPSPPIPEVEKMTLGRRIGHVALFGAAGLAGGITGIEIVNAIGLGVPMIMEAGIVGATTTQAVLMGHNQHR